VAVNPDALLAGPRGRMLCWELIFEALPDRGRGDRWTGVWQAIHRGDLSDHLADLEWCVRLVRSELTDVGDRLMLRVFGRAVGDAAYWQPPSDEDHALAEPGVQAVLTPIAELITTSAAARWWDTPLDRATQTIVEREPDLPDLAGIADKLAKWRADTVNGERQAFRDRPDDPAANYGGHWWSVPALAQVPKTTRTIPDIGPVGLGLVEDALGWTNGRCWPVSVPPNARVFEVTSLDSWAELVGRYPLDVPYSRRHDWWRVTGLDEHWLIPDYAAVAADHDAIHLTAAAYLSAAGCPVRAGGGFTMLAGWDPDQTYWLNDVLRISGSPRDWRGDHHDAGEWHPVY
jgi:hypothetical protein